MEVYKAIFGRRSVRDFLDKKIEQKKLDTLLQSAIWAPTGGNSQPWFFIAISRPVTLKLIKAVSPGLNGTPTALIIVCSARIKNIEKMGPSGEILAIMDCSMAAQNIMLMACDLGLGSCAIRSFNEKAVREIVKIPDDITPELLIALGYPARDISPPPREKQVIFWEEFGANKAWK